MSALNPYQSPGRDTPFVVAGGLPVRVTGVLTVNDGIEALRAVGKWPTWRRNILAVVLIVFAAVLVVASLRQNHLAVGGAFIAVGGLLLLVSPLFMRLRFAKAWNARTEHRQPIVWIFSEDGLYIETINSKHLHSWDSFVSSKITAHTIVLAQQGATMFNFVPTKLFSSDQELDAVKRLLDAKLPPR